MRSLVLVTTAVVLLGCSSSDIATTANPASDAGGQCAPVLGSSPAGCPDTQPAEAAFAEVESSCGVVDADLDTTNPDSPTLTAAGKAKLCTTCDCQKAVYAYETLYANCTGSDSGNTALAKNIYAVASACK